MELYITDEYRKEEIFHRLKSRLGVETISISALLYRNNDDDEAQVFFRCAAKIRKHADELQYYKDMLAYPAFFQELISFARQLAEWQIGANELPERDESEKELKKLLGWILEEDLKEKKIHDGLSKRLDEIAATENIRIIPGFETDSFRYSVLKQLEDRGVPREVPKINHPSAYEKHILSGRQEIEAVAQDICTRKKPCLVVLSSPSLQMPLVHQVFARYGIPASYIGSPEVTRAGDAFNKAVDFMLEKNAHKLLQVFACGLLAPLEGQLLSYLTQVMTETEAPQIADAYEAVLKKIHSREDDAVKKNRELDIFRRLDKQAEKYFKKIDAPLQKMLKAESPQDILRTAYEVLSVSPLLENEADYAAGMEIRKELMTILPLIETEEDVRFAAETIRCGAVSNTSSLSSFCTVTDLHHPMDARKVTYVLGCTGRDYPGFKAMDGLFDEDYVREIPSFPSLSQREKEYTEQLAWIPNSAEEEIFWSFSTNDYEGRKQEPSFELKRMFPGDDNDGERWQIVSASGKRGAKHVLSKDTSRALFEKEDENGPYVRGSVSSIESWFSCPYRYFIASGLYVRKAQIPKIDAANIGTIQHAVMENALHQAPEDYTAWLSDENIASVIDPYFEALKIIEPHRKDMIEISRKRMLKSLRRSVDFLQEYETCTMFKPYQAEKYFPANAVSEHIRLNGTIDRINIDEGNHLLEILDYKSSSKSLSQSKVQAGQQLQLLSYLLVALDLYEEYEAGGAYYFSMKEENIADAKDTAAASVERRSFTVTESDLSSDSEYIRSLVRKKRMLQGWATTDHTDAIDRDKNHVSGLSSVYRIDLVRECLETLYEYFYEQLFSDEESSVEPKGISLAPIEHACTYCDYAGICRFHGDVRDPVRIYKKDLKTGKETG